MFSEPGVASALLHPPFKVSVPPAARTTPPARLLKVPVTVSSEASASISPWFSTVAPARPSVPWNAPVSTVIPDPIVSVCPADVGRITFVNVLPPNTTFPDPLSVCVPLNSRLAVPDPEEFTAIVRPAPRLNPPVTLTVAPPFTVSPASSVTPFNVELPEVAATALPARRLTVRLVSTAPLAIVAVLVPAIVSVPPLKSTCAAMDVVPATPGFIVRFSTSPPAVPSAIFAPALMTILRLALSVSVLVPMPL